MDKIETGGGKHGCKDALMAARWLPSWYVRHALTPPEDRLLTNRANMDMAASRNFDRGTGI